MIATQEPVVHREIFRSIRSSIQELHADKVILEDVNGTPFLFKSRDAQVWARIFYRSMRDYTVEALQGEIKKLWVLMPNDAVLYLFYPELDREQIIRMNGFSDRLSFFEYAGLFGPDHEQAGVRICKWIPSAMPLAVSYPEIPSASVVRPVATSCFQKGRLTSAEVADLAALSQALHRA
jgi:hypothetical protein